MAEADKPTAATIDADESPVFPVPGGTRSAALFLRHLLCLLPTTTLDGKELLFSSILDVTALTSHVKQSYFPLLHKFSTDACFNAAQSADDLHAKIYN